jgi:hypothetical protein
MGKAGNDPRREEGHGAEWAADFIDFAVGYVKKQGGDVEEGKKARERAAQYMSDYALMQITAMQTRPGADGFYYILEHRFYPPGMKSNDQFQFCLQKWHSHDWLTCFIPWADFERAREVATEVKLHLQPGNPIIHERDRVQIIATHDFTLPEKPGDLWHEADRFPICGRHPFVLEGGRGAYEFHGTPEQHYRFAHKLMLEEQARFEARVANS